MSNHPPGKRKKSLNHSRKPAKIKGEDPSSYLLRILLSSVPYYVSGTILAQKLKMSRVGIWSRIDKLRKSGIKIEAYQNLGYRIVHEPNKLNFWLLSARLANSSSKLKSLHLHESIDSTNSEAERLLANQTATPFAVAANRQINGRGRLGRKWHSPKNGNIYLSIAFRPEVEISRLKTFTLWQGIMICDFLRQQLQTDKIFVKWPNDLFFKDKKIGGILTEASIDGDRINSLILGIGLNLNSSLSDFPKELKDYCQTLMEIHGRQVRVNEYASKIIETILMAYKDCLHDKTSTYLLEKWRGVDFLCGKKIKFTHDNSSYTGKAMGIDAEGNLEIKLRNGKKKFLHSGEVQIQK